MFAIFLPALNFRGNRSPFLWWFYKFVSEFGQEAVYICGDEYFLHPNVHRENNRTEIHEEAARNFGFQIPDERLLRALPKVNINAQVWQALEELFPANPPASFRHFCLNEDPVLREAFIGAFDQIKKVDGEVEAVITCVNCATLQRFCKEQSLPLLHLELGPFRSPHYLGTAYFDFSGVNGGTESQERFSSARNSTDGMGDLLSIEAIRSLLMARNGLPPVQSTVGLGIALQVEDDTNIICYSNGFSSVSLLNNARNLLIEEKVAKPVLVRGHPGSFFSPRGLPPGLDVDPSRTAMEFIQRCDEVHAINSSLAVEFLLQGKKAVVFGESPFAFCVDPDTHQHKASNLSFFCLNYLVPWRLATSADYIRWRLRNSSERAIMDVHLEFYMREKIALLESRVADLERELNDRDEQIAVLRASTFWRFSYFFRRIFNVVVRR